MVHYFKIETDAPILPQQRNAICKYITLVVESGSLRNQVLVTSNTNQPNTLQIDIFRE
jgi:hypothetical protein